MLRLSLLALLAAGPALAQPQPIQLARDGKALVPVVVARDASPRVKQAAGDLAMYLGKMTGARFEVATGDGTTGVAVGLPGQFPALGHKDRWAKPTVEEREDYFIDTRKERAELLGATDLAVEHAVWDFLYQLGYRQFFPGEHWEVVPKTPDLSATMQASGSPSYRSRRIWYGFGAWDYAAEPYRQWCVRNRATGGVELHTGHAYGGIIRGLQAEFDKHPEYYPLINGERRPSKEAKLCIGNEDLRKLVVQYELTQFKKNPALDSVSLDPSDGGGWCECPKCKALGSVSDRALLLANEVAAAVNEKYAGKLVGLYAYNYHSPPPTIKVNPNVVVSVATAFIKGGLTVDELLAGWAKQGATLGIREYYSVNTWDRDQPGHARGGNLDYLTRTIPEFHAKGARFLSAESSDNWGPNGLGYYLAARMMWDLREAGRIDKLVEDFLSKAFGPAKEPMRAFYEQLDGSKPHLVADDQLGRMFRALAEARKLAGDDAAIQARLADLAEYAHYDSLYQQYAKSDGPARQASFEALIRHAYRMRATMLVHTKALYRDLAGRDKTVTIPAGAKWSDPEGKNPWKSSKPFAADEIAALIDEGIQRHPLVKLAFEPVKFSDKLVPATPLKLPAADPGDFGPGRGVQTYLVHVEKAPATIELKITGGLIVHYRDRGNVKVALWKLGGASATGEKETLAAEDRSAPPDGTEHPIKLTAKDAGLYRLTISDGMDRTEVKLPRDLPVVVPSTQDAPMNAHHGQWMAYFYVPKGTKTIGLFGGEHGEVQDSRNRTVFWLNGRKRDFHAVPVPDGQDGKVWRVRYGRGDVRLLTVPPYFAPTPGQLLLPAEVVERDR
jgi:Domain of unknown function (DUF4838)